MTEAQDRPGDPADQPERARADDDPEGANPDTGEAPGTDDQKDSEPERPDGD